MRSSVDKYFEGYEKTVVEKANGKGTATKFVYTGEYYHISQPKEQVKKHKIIYGVFFLIYMVLYFYTSFLDTDASHTQYVGLISLAILIPAVYWIGGLWNFLTAKEYMEQRKYLFGLKRILSSTKGIMWLSGAQILGEGIFLIVSHDKVNSFAMEGIFVVFALVEVVTMYLFIKYQKKLVEAVEQVPNKLAKEEMKDK